MTVDDLLTAFKEGSVSAEELKKRLLRETYMETGSAKLDSHRPLRTGHPEVVFCPGKTPQQVAEAFQGLAKSHGRVLGTKADEKQRDTVSQLLDIQYDSISGLLWHGDLTERSEGKIVVVSAGTSDLPVAEEAAKTAEFHGSRVVRHFDCGVAGIHRLFGVMDEFVDAAAIVVAAGMDGALPSVVSGVAPAPVIAVPTSVGYGASFGGLAALLTMLNGCAPGISVVNIDNGFGAGYLAHIINERCLRK